MYVYTHAYMASFYRIYTRINYNYLAIYSLIHGFIFSNIFSTMQKHDQHYYSAAQARI